MYWVDSIESKIYPKGAVIFSAGEPEDGTIYYVLTGAIQLVRLGSEGPVVMRSIQQQNFFGEMAVLTGNNRTISAIVVSTEARVAALPKQSFLLLAASRPEGLLDICRGANIRYLNALQKLAEMRADGKISSEMKWEINEVDPATQLDLEQFVRGLPSLEYYKLQIIYDNQQAYPRGIYWIKSGAVELAIESEGKSLLNLNLAEGDMFGLISLLDRATTATVKAVAMVETTNVNYIDKENLLIVTKKNPLLAYALLRSLLLRAERIENMIPLA
ncbi:MAG: cyclic nucleotide-binding domain-containing protein [Turneriella sp.]|nr:cyclic nucleotide-binding domain-containing protein [Turneriella sp.]